MFKFLKYLFKDFFIFSAAYSNDVFPDPLDKDEEAKCIELLKVGDKDARAKLIEHNLRLVAHIVKKYENNKDDNDDLISIGTIGLIKGIDSYSKSHNTRITTYIARCIENEILMYYRNNKKHSKNVSINESIGFDKEGNEIGFGKATVRLAAKFLSAFTLFLPVFGSGRCLHDVIAGTYVIRKKDWRFNKALTV